LAINIFGGFILNLLPGGLGALSWAYFLGAVIVAFSLLGAYLRRGQQQDAASPPRVRLTLSAIILLGTATLVAIFSVLYSLAGAAQQPRPGFTQLWILPPAKSCTVRLGVRSFELAPTSYHMRVTVDGTPIDGGLSFSLAPQKEWDRSLPIIIPAGTNKAEVAVNLYRLQRPQTVYRHVHLTLYPAGVAVQLCTTLPPVSSSPQPTPTFAGVEPACSQLPPA
jgi:hypothetical protein